MNNDSFSSGDEWHHETSSDSSSDPNSNVSTPVTEDTPEEQPRVNGRDWQLQTIGPGREINDSEWKAAPKYCGLRKAEEGKYAQDTTHQSR